MTGAFVAVLDGAAYSLALFYFAAAPTVMVERRIGLRVMQLPASRGYKTPAAAFSGC